jgi:hypothetical protein
VSGTLGYGYDVTGNLKEGGAVTESLKPGWGTAIGTVVPGAIGAARSIKAVAGTVLPHVAANLSGTPVEAYKQMNKGDVVSNIGKTTPESVLSEARDSQSVFDKTIKHNFGEGKKEIINKFTGIRIGLNGNEQTGLKKIATEFGFADRLPQNLNTMSAKESMDLLAEINHVNPVTSVDTPLVKNYKLALSELKDAIKTKAISQFGGTEGIFDKTYQAYAEGKKVLQDISSIIGKPGIKLTPMQQSTAQNRLMKIFNEDKNAYLTAIQTLEEKTSSKIIDKIAAAQLSPILPKTLRGGGQTGVIGLGSDLLGLTTFPLSSPRMGAWLVSKVTGASPSVVVKLMRLSPKIRESIYNAVSKENMSLDDAIRKFAKDLKGLPNKEGGFVNFGKGVQDSSESIQSRIPLAKATNQTTPIKTKNATNMITNDTTSVTKVNKAIDDNISSNIDELIGYLEDPTVRKNIDLDKLQELEEIRDAVTKRSLSQSERRAYNEIAASAKREDLVYIK